MESNNYLCHKAALENKTDQVKEFIFNKNVDPYYLYKGALKNENWELLKIYVDHILDKRKIDEFEEWTNVADNTYAYQDNNYQYHKWIKSANRKNITLVTSASIITN